MPRTLPWLGNTAPKRTTATVKPVNTLSGDNTHSVPNRQQTRPQLITTRLVGDAKEDDLANIEYMKPDDDQWIMVEDEFLSTAQLFTHSVHRKEYELLQLEAASKNASQISKIQRPVTGTSIMSKETLKRREMAAKERLQLLLLSRAAPKKSSLDSSDDEVDLDPCSEWATSELRMLMRTHIGSEASLGSLLKHNPVATRAAAGYTDSQTIDSSQGRDSAPKNQYESQKNRDSAPSSRTTAHKRAISSHPHEYILELDMSTEDNGGVGDLNPLTAKIMKPEVCSQPSSSFVRKPNTRPFNLDSSQLKLRSKVQTIRPEPLDLDIDIFPTKPSTTKFRGKSMAARERAIRNEVSTNVNSDSAGEQKGGFDTLNSL